MDKELYNSLLKEYNVINGLEGKPAPAITAITTNGNTFDLESLKGKVVLLDIWSTTCAPCIKAIPESVKLQDELKNKSFVALNLCLNSNEDDWKKLIAKKNWIGTHIFSQNDKEAYSNYHFNSFPQYILIDKNGNIVRTNSERPVNDKLKKEILKLLDQK
jgi:thiol-disulfide isomerase/thioredoxin